MTTPSKMEKFRVSLVQEENKPYKTIRSVDNKNFVIASEGQTFFIEMIQSGSAKEVIGSKLWIDGKEIHGIKTFRYRTNYYGFKLGNGTYKRFVFGVPPEKDYRVPNDSIKRENRNFGKIKIEFYSTQVCRSKKRDKKGARYVPYNQSVREEGQKFYERALSVKEGEVFSIEPPKFMGSHERNGEFEDDYIIDYNDPIDGITILYQDFYSLQIKGIISLKNIKHLEYIPEDFLRFDRNKKKLVVVVFETILKKEREVHFEQMENIFKQYTKLDFITCMPEGIHSFLSEHPGVFSVDRETLKVTLTDVCRIQEKLCELPILPSEEYFKKSSVKDYTKSTTCLSERSTLLNEKLKRMNVQEIICLDESDNEDCEMSQNKANTELVKLDNTQNLVQNEMNDNYRHVKFDEDELIFDI